MIVPALEPPISWARLANLSAAQGASLSAFALFAAFVRQPVSGVCIVGGIVDRFCGRRVLIVAAGGGMGSLGARPVRALLHALLLGVEQSLDVGNGLFRADVLDWGLCRRTASSRRLALDCRFFGWRWLGRGLFAGGALSGSRLLAGRRLRCS